MVAPTRHMALGGNPSSAMMNLMQPLASAEPAMIPKPTLTFGEQEALLLAAIQEIGEQIRNRQYAMADMLQRLKALRKRKYDGQ